MNSYLPHPFILLIGLAISVGTAHAQTATIERVAGFENVQSFMSLAGDGTAFAVTLENSFFDREAVLVQADGNIVSLGFGGASMVSGISSDGSVVTFRDGGGESKIWRDGVISDPPPPPAPFTSVSVEALSADGRRIAGNVFQDSLRFWSYIADLDTGLFDVFPVSAISPFEVARVEDLSADGSTIVGLGGTLFGGTGAIARNDEGVRLLEGDPTDAFPFSVATAASANGDIVFGSTASLGRVDQLVRWEGGITQFLGAPGTVTAVSENGSRAVGTACLTARMSCFASEVSALYWTQSIGLRDLQTVLASEYGVEIPGFRMFRVGGISDDGLTMIGIGCLESECDNLGQGGNGLFRVTLDTPIEVALPEPQFGAQLAAGLLFAFGLARRR